MSPEPNLEHAELELKHIQLELKHNRFDHLRSFIDQYYCYRVGHVKRTGRADWDAPVWKGNVSVAARACGSDRTRVVKEHAVPLSVIKQYLAPLAGQQDTALSQIATVLEKYTVFATITKEEDARLRKAGLWNSMPIEYSDPNHPYFDDPLARYKCVGIEFESLKQSTGSASEILVRDETLSS